MDEFGWYIGSRAGHAPSVPKVIEQLSDACDFIQMKKDKKGGKILPDSAKENNDLYGKILVGFKKVGSDGAWGGSGQSGVRVVWGQGWE